MSPTIPNVQRSCTRLDPGRAGTWLQPGFRHAWILVVMPWFATDDASAQERASGFAAIAGVGFGYRPPTELSSGGFVDLGLPDDVLLLEGLYWRGSHLVAVRRSEVHHQYLSQDVSDVGILYGRTDRDGPATGHVAAGVAYVTEQQVESGTGSRVHRRVVGVPIEAGGSVGWSRIALGLSVFANFNSAASFFGTALTIQVGALER